MIVLLSIIHVAGRIHVNVPVVDPKRLYIQFGIIAFIVFFYMAFASARPLRNAYYSLFIITHVGGFLLILVALWIHRPQVSGWLAAGAALYFVDRVWRTGRIALYHWLPYRRVPDLGGPQAWVELLSSDLMRVTVRTRQRWKPGSHTYLHCPGISAGGHPFSGELIYDI